MFQNFKNIDLTKSQTWQGKKILTFDIDWASDQVLLDTIYLLEASNVKATFFVTHATDVLDRIRSNPNFEIAIHPNFNEILDHKTNKKAEDIFHEILEIVPEAKISRSHSLTNSGRWNTIYKENHIQFTSNYFMYLKHGISPIKNINEVIEVPIFFADDALLYLNNNNDDLFFPEFKINNTEGIEVYLFHPIHVALNSNSLDFYENSREFHSNWNKIKSFKNPKLGIRDYLIQLINFIK